MQNHEYSGDGVFKLIKNCLNAENKTYKSEEYHGRRYTQRGIPGDNDATVWQLKADDGTIFNFLLLLSAKLQEAIDRKGRFHLQESVLLV